MRASGRVRVAASLAPTITQTMARSSTMKTSRNSKSWHFQAPKLLALTSTVVRLLPVMESTNQDRQVVKARRARRWKWGRCRAAAAAKASPENPEFRHQLPRKTLVEFLFLVFPTLLVLAEWYYFFPIVIYSRGILFFHPTSAR
ncbi:hypothetical protein SAY87_002062 [Trapa incisa]|uniref:Uncharacterized protein n=1 Tax=Trapa incisa TaxID=236973 RepID=A0AAN7JTI6_9MYRT|nr:hypothetical protein SAY87_002062 [Trapa incisa]